MFSEECKAFGDKGVDKAFCASQGGEFTCNECSLYYNIKRDYCPVMCGLCDRELPSLYQLITAAIAGDSHI